MALFLFGLGTACAALEMPRSPDLLPETDGPAAAALAIDGAENTDDTDDTDDLFRNVATWLKSGAGDVDRRVQVQIRSEGAVKEVRKTPWARTCVKDVAALGLPASGRIQREDDRWGFVQNLTEAMRNELAQTKHRFYCLLQQFPLSMDNDPVKVDGKVGLQLGQMFSSKSKSKAGTDGPTCALVSHSGDFQNMSDSVSFQEEIDMHDVVIRFNDHGLDKGTRGCRTTLRVLNNQFVLKRFREFFATSNHGFGSGSSRAAEAFLFLYNQRWDCATRANHTELLRMASVDANGGNFRPVYTLHPRYEQQVDSVLMNFVKEDPLLQGCLWTGAEQKDTRCHRDFRHRFAVPTKKNGAYPKPTIGFSTTWTALQACSRVSLYGYGSDGFSSGIRLWAHRTSLAEQTLWKVLADRIEKLTDSQGRTSFVYHLAGLHALPAPTGCADLRALGDMANEGAAGESSGWGRTSGAPEVPAGQVQWCKGAQDPAWCAGTMEPGFCTEKAGAHLRQRGQ